MADNRYCLRIKVRCETCRYVHIFLLIFSIIVTIQKTKNLPIKANQQRGQMNTAGQGGQTRCSHSSHNIQSSHSVHSAILLGRSTKTLEDSEKCLCRPGLCSRTSADRQHVNPELTACLHDTYNTGYSHLEEILVLEW